MTTRGSCLFSGNHQSARFSPTSAPPQVSRALDIDIEELRRRFPTAIEPLMDVRTIHLHLGHAAVINYLSCLQQADLTAGFQENELIEMGVM